MYHRVARPDMDIWELAVSPAHFQQQLRVMQQVGNVIPAAELIERLQNGTLKKNSIVITFDDGYIDNFTHASPLLSKYQLPATFFIISENAALAREFWWDELASLLLLSKKLPALFSLAICAEIIEANLTYEQYLTNELQQKHQQWKASSEVPPSRRAQLFYELWLHLKTLASSKQQQLLHQIRVWANLHAVVRPDYLTITRSQLQELNANPLFTIGAHTVTHPALAYQQVALQHHELVTSKQELEQAIGQKVALLAYPFGSYNAATITTAAEVGFSAAFTTEAKTVTKKTECHQVGRFQVNDWDGESFRWQLKHWFSQ